LIKHNDFISGVMFILQLRLSYQEEQGYSVELKRLHGCSVPLKLSKGIHEIGKTLSTRGDIGQPGQQYI
jgi:hypothetical protein